MRLNKEGKKKKNDPSQILDAMVTKRQVFHTPNVLGDFTRDKTIVLVRNSLVVSCERSEVEGT